MEKTIQQMVDNIIKSQRQLFIAEREVVRLKERISVNSSDVIRNIEKGKSSGDPIRDLVIARHRVFGATELEEKYRSLESRLKGNIGQCVITIEKKDWQEFAGFPNNHKSREQLNIGILSGESFISGNDGFRFSFFFPVEKCIAYWTKSSGRAGERYSCTKKMDVPHFLSEETLSSGKYKADFIVSIGNQEISDYLETAPEDSLLFLMEVTRELGIEFDSSEFKEFVREQEEKLSEEIADLRSTIHLIGVGCEFKDETKESAEKKLAEVLTKASKLGISVPSK
ncbi:MAG: hypothetical protein WC682_04880 [Parcubacteria group bacterium]|jgi:hypothetical protein